MTHGTAPGSRRQDDASTFLFFYDAVYPWSVGGVEHRNLQLARALGGRGHRVVLAGWAPAAESPHLGVTVRPIGRPRSLYGRSGRRSLRQALRLAWQAARIDLTGIDVVETSNIPLAHIFPLSFRCRRARIPLVVTWHEFWGGHWRRYLRRRSGTWRIPRWIERRATKAGTRAIAVSRMTADRVASIRGDDVEIVPNGIPLAEIRALAAGSPVQAAAPLIYAGRLMEHKRLELLIDAAALLAEETDGPLVTIVGDGPAREALEDQTARLDLAGRVEFIGRLDSGRDVWRLVAGAKLAVLPSRREGFGLFALEAMSLGVPVVHCVSPESAVADLVRDGIDGVAVAPDPESLAETVARLLGDEPERRRMASNASERAAGYDWALVADTFEWAAAGADPGAQPAS